MLEENSMKKTKNIMAFVLIVAVLFGTLAMFVGCAEPTQSIKTKEELVSFMTEGSDTKLLLENDIELDTEGQVFSMQKNFRLDLNNKTLTVRATAGVEIAEDAELKMTNGTINFVDVPNGRSAINLLGGLELDGVKMSAQTGSLILPRKGSTLTIKNSEITGQTYAVSTNANTAVATDQAVSINISNSKLTATSDSGNNGDDCAMMINIPANVMVENSEIVGDRQSMIVRGGNVTVKNTTITNNATYANKTQYLSAKWGSGNEVPMAGIVVGNRHAQGVAQTAYQYKSNLTLQNVTFDVENGNGSNIPDVYAYANENADYGVEIMRDSLSYNIVNGSNANVEINAL